MLTREMINGEADDISSSRDHILKHLLEITMARDAYGILASLTNENGKL
jgi:hypothetical protein